MRSPFLSPHICRPAWEARLSSPKASLCVQYTFHTPWWCGCGITSLDIEIEFWTEVHPISSGTCYKVLNRREKQQNRKDGKQFGRPMRQRPRKQRDPTQGPLGRPRHFTEELQRGRFPQSCTSKAKVRAGWWPAALLGKFFSSTNRILNLKEKY